MYSTTVCLYLSTLISAYGVGPPKVIGLTEGHGGDIFNVYYIELLVVMSSTAN